MCTYSGTEWDAELINTVWKDIRSSGDKFGWRGYDVQYEIVAAKQMIDMCVSHGMPVYYNHWSFGKNFLAYLDTHLSDRGGSILEMVINSDPCICYLKDNNSLALQIEVIAHASVGHNHFFKNNYLFRTWTNPKQIINKLLYTKTLIADLEEKLGENHVEKLLDCIHMISHYGVDKYITKYKTKDQLQKEQDQLVTNIKNSYDKTTHSKDYMGKWRDKVSSEKDSISGENLFKFLCTNPHMEPEIRELFVVIGEINQYFYPQYQTKVMNEGFASFVAYEVMYDLWNDKLISEAHMLEYLDSHTRMIYQSTFNCKRMTSLNPYYLGYKMFVDIKRMCENPTEEDKEFLPDFAGSNWNETINHIVTNYKDETFINKFLSPHLIRELKLMQVSSNHNMAKYVVTASHRHEDYNVIRRRLSIQNSVAFFFPTLDINLTKDIDEEHRDMLELEFKIDLDNRISIESLDFLNQVLNYFYKPNIIKIKNLGQL